MINLRHEHVDGLDDDHHALFWHLMIEHDMVDQPGELQQTPLDELVHLHRRDHGDAPGQHARGMFQVIDSSALWNRYRP